jgi:nucleoside-diphosphate-sugar epimerase
MRILVTGATGFVGGHLVKRLLAEKHEVHVVVRVSTDLAVFGDDLDRIVSHRHYDTTEDMIDLVRNAQPDVVMHLASLFLGEHQPENVDDLITSNVLFSTQLAEAMAVNEVQLLVNVGTSWQHHEDDDYNPVNLYAATKQAFRSILRFYIETGKLKVINLELFDTFGPNDQRGKLFALLERLRTSGDELAMSPGDQQIDPIYIDDVSEAFVVALKRLRTRLGTGDTASEETYSVRSDAPIQLKDLVKVYENVTGMTLNIEWGGRPYRAREVMTPWSRGETLPGWSVKVSLKEGIEKVLKSDV